MFQDAPQFSLQWDRSLVTTFRSPVTVPSLKGSVPGSTFLACYFALSACRFFCPFGLSAPQPVLRFSPDRTVSSLQARCSFHDRLLLPLTYFRSRLGLFNPAGSTLRQVPLHSGPPSDSARFPLTPRSLFARVGYGSSFLVRYVSGGSAVPQKIGRAHV